MSNRGKHGNHWKGERVDRVTIICAHCGKERLYLQSFLNVHPMKYCSRSCSGLSMRSKVKVSCNVCKTEFERRSDKVRERNYCSKDCSQIGRTVEGAKWRDPVQIKMYMKKYAKDHRNELNEKSLLRDQKYPEAKKARTKRYINKNRVKLQVNANLRRDKKIGGDFNHLEWLDIMKKYNYTCLKCNKKEPEIKLTIDHIVPLSKGGLHKKDNIQPLCRSCNSRKHTKIIDYRPGIKITEV